MSFLQPLLLLALPLMLLPVVIHLIHLHRRRAVRWAAMMFLRAAQRMNQGLSRIKRYLILTARVLAIAALILLAGRPLAGGLLGLTGGAPDTVLLLIDRSASMEERDLATGMSKRSTGLARLTGAIREAYGARSRLLVIDSATLAPVEIPGANELSTLPAAQATAASADIPAMLQAALDHITTNQTGRTDIWLVSDLRQSDWDAQGGRWEPLRSAFASLSAVRFHLLSYPQVAEDNLSIRVDRALVRKSAGGAELLLDARITRNGGPPPGPVELPLRLNLNGTASALNLTLREQELTLQAHRVPLDASAAEGWGVLELPPDSNPADNHAAFVFGPAPGLASVVVAADADLARPFQAALSARTDPTRAPSCLVLEPGRAAEIDWENTALVVWHAPVPLETDILHRQLAEFAAQGRALIFLPPLPATDSQSFAGLHWTPWRAAPAAEEPPAIDWWRTDTDLLANTRDGSPLPVNIITLAAHAPVAGAGVTLAKLGADPVLVRSALEEAPQVWFLGTHPGSAASNLASEGVVQFALLQRALQSGAAAMGNARARLASRSALAPEPGEWAPVITLPEDAPSAQERALRTGILRRDTAEGGQQWIAINRQPAEDGTATLERAAVETLFNGLDARFIEDSVQDTRSLASEVWRTFLAIMALALLTESILCLPRRPGASVVTPPASAFSSGQLSSSS
jgi:hypothetical protein